MLLTMPAQAREGWISLRQSGLCPYESPALLETEGPGWKAQFHLDLGLVILEEVVTGPARPMPLARLAELGKQALAQFRGVCRRMQVSRFSE